MLTQYYHMLLHKQEVAANNKQSSKMLQLLTLRSLPGDAVTAPAQTGDGSNKQTHKALQLLTLRSLAGNAVTAPAQTGDGSQQQTNAQSAAAAHPPQLGRQRAQGVNDSVPLGPFGYGVLAEGQGHHGDDHHLAGVGLGGRHANLTASVDVDTAVCVAGDGAAHCVGDANAQRSPVLGVVQGLQGQASLSHALSRSWHA